MPGPKTKPAEMRFWQKVCLGEGCWEWLASRYPEGYGVFRIGSRLDGSYRTIPAHRFAYELLRGAIPDGFHLDHLCRNPGCVNPWHLEVVTGEENMQRGLSLQKKMGTYVNAQSRKTHCPQGHSYDERNTYVNRQGKRECRTCHREKMRARRGSILRRRSSYYDGGPSDGRCNF